jgi:hypothetical protein
MFGGIVGMIALFGGPLAVFLVVSYFGAPWWAALILTVMFGGIGIGLIQFLGIAVAKMLGIPNKQW